MYLIQRISVKKTIRKLTRNHLSRKNINLTKIKLKKKKKLE